jgi:crotonobetainyl-CoA:carnitine CoA-transferase CaiB-like acyl-CoA transferase
VQANGYLLEARTTDGPVRLCANPVQFGGEPPAVRSAAADAGAHTEEVLLEHGCTWEDVARWKEAGVIS